MLEVTQTVSSELFWLTPVLLLLLPLSVACSVYATVHAKDKQYDLRLFEPANNLWRSVLYHATGLKLANAKDAIYSDNFIGVRSYSYMTVCLPHSSTLYVCLHVRHELSTAAGCMGSRKARSPARDRIEYVRSRALVQNGC